MTVPKRDRTGSSLGNMTLRERIADFLNAYTTMSLATVGPDGTPAVAALFYAADDRLNLFFLSEEHTLHASNLMVNGSVAATVQGDCDDWRTLHGLQLRGVARLVPAGGWLRAAAVYVRRFAFVEPLLSSTSAPSVLAGPLARAKLFVVEPTWVRLIDNRVSFGFKEELSLGHIDEQL